MIYSKFKTILTVGIQSTLVPVVGTPSAISGVIGAYYFKTFPTSIFMTAICIPALVYISLWFILQAIFGISVRLAEDILCISKGADNKEKDTIVGQLFIMGKVTLRV
jgi:membrane associated rhomboid family serine protease